MKSIVWNIVAIIIVFIAIILALRYLGTQFGGILSILGLGGTGYLVRAQKKARKKHEEIASHGPDAVTNDIVDRLRKRRRQSEED